MKDTSRVKQPEGMEQYRTTFGGLTSIIFCPKLKTIKVLKLYAENYKIIEVISNQYNASTITIAKKLGLSRERTLQILREFEKAGIIKSEKDKRNIHHWSHTKYKGDVLRRLFSEMCNIVESPLYQATAEEISNCINLIKNPDPVSRRLGLKVLEKFAVQKYLLNDRRVIDTLLTIIEDPSNDQFKENIMNCLIYILPSPLEDSEKRDEIEKMNAENLQQSLMKQEIKIINETINKLYSGKVIDALKRYCFNKPFSPGTISLTLIIMRMINEESAVKSMTQVVQDMSLPFHYQNILLPAYGLSTPMKEKLIDNIMELAVNHTNEEICSRAKFILDILMDNL